MAVLEICVDSLESALAAQKGGADRIELCSGLAEGGVTPSAGLLRVVRAKVSGPLHVLIRPRPGDFLYSAEEVMMMREDIAIVKGEGANGVALGLLTQEGLVDVERMRGLVEAAQPMEVTFHRAFDLVLDPERALAHVAETGAGRVLTSGGELRAQQGQQRIAQLVRMAGETMKVMVGGGVRPENVQGIAQVTGAQEFHAALRRSSPSPMRHQVPAVQLGDACTNEYVRRVVRVDDVRNLRRAADAALART